VQIDTPAESEEMALVCYQHSLDLEGCLPKHHRQKPKVKGSGFTGAILSDAATFLSLVEPFLCYHAWCHHSDKLPVELQEDMDLVSFSVRTVVLYLDTIVYHGNNTVDNDTCKNHTQLHADRYFGRPMQSNTEIGEQGLKTWAKKVSRTALKHGRDVFTYSTSNRVGESSCLTPQANLWSGKKQGKLRLPRLTTVHNDYMVD
jgi:hypothetical protein